MAKLHDILLFSSLDLSETLRWRENDAKNVV